MTLRLLPAFSLSLLFIAAAPAQEKKPKRDRTSNRGPEQAELKFKLPRPPVRSAEETRQTFKLAPGFRIECIIFPDPLPDRQHQGPPTGAAGPSRPDLADCAGKVETGGGQTPRIGGGKGGLA